MEPYLLKVMPMVIALVYLVNTVSSYLGIDLPILASIAGMSLIPLIFMYVSSYVLGINISDRDLFILNMAIAGVSLFIILYLYVKSYKKPTVKDSR